ncbi:restriction endonuclease subunit S [Vibrio cholerae]|uniref:restriction endonuclease subunit S n=1 Tax=Vibrio cholerae TaxID=666 RepID=UPI001159DE16|nr:restriction endonuclease subunit S [Vibrio cholerae]TQP53680.1 restriction endonuclease subunit S [Vibrio cholerae]
MSWQVKTLGELVTIKGGGTPSKKIADYWGGTIPWASVKDLKSRVLLNTEDSITELGVVKSATNVIPKGTIIVPTRMALGKVAITGCDMAINQDLKALIIVDNKQINQCYLARFLESKSSFIESEGKGATVKGITLDFLKSLEIPLPPLDEQKRIAAILDKADAIRQKRKQAITLADEFLRSVFLDMFGDPVTNPKGWEEPILSDIADVRSGVTKGKKLKEGTGITLPYMRVANVQDGYLDLSSIQTITVSEKDAEKCKLLRGDILLTEGGDPDKLGRGHVWNGEIDNCIHQNHIFSVRVKDEDYVRPAFLSAVIGSQRGKRYFLKVGKQTTGIATINKTVLSEFCPIVPPLELQDSYLKIASRIKRMQTRKHYHEVTLFPSLSQKAFSGQL